MDNPTVSPAHYSVRDEKVNRLSLYDFDGTVYNGDSFIDFWKYTVRTKAAGLMFIPYQVLMIGCYLMKLLSAGRLKESLLIQVGLFEREELRKHIGSFWAVHACKINPWVNDVLREDRENRLVTMCISASPGFILEPIVESLGFDALIATGFLVENGKQTNRLCTPNCRGGEKVTRLNDWAEKAGKAFTVEKFYSDSDADAPLYSIAGQSYCVKDGILSRKEPAFKKNRQKTG